ncbi:SpoIIE family protein phosphatase [Limibacter armeniacum]|uniref:SpoIIE family protein phosphatase n=1 Tax=Limibacter armeniacum TaxID=466084 RepID=UPI002FE69D5E
MQSYLLKRIVLFIFTQLILLSIAQAQDNRKLHEHAWESFEEKNYTQAAYDYELLLKDTPNDLDIQLYLAICYLKTFRSEKALSLLDQLNNTPKSANRDYYFYLAEAHYQLEKFNKALKLTTLSKVYPQGNENIDELESKIKRSIEAYRMPVPVMVRNLGQINSPNNEHSIILTKDHQTIMFTCQLPNNQSNLEECIYKAKMNHKGNWLTPTKVDKMNLTGNAATVQLYANDTKAIVYLEGDLYTSELVNGQWTPPSPLKQINSKKQEAHCFVSEDERTIIFSSRGFMGEGKMETSDMNLFQIKKDPYTERWGPVTPLSELNTSKNEDAPFIAEDGTLYFSSEGHGAIGGYDIFKSVYNKSTGKWSKPQHLGYPINSVADDIYFSTYGKIAYFSSSRKGGKGMLDIYRVFLFDKVKVSGVVVNKEQEPQSNTKVRMTHLGEFYESYTNNDGRFELLVPAEGNYYLTVAQDDNIYIEGNQHLELSLRNTSEEQKNDFTIGLDTSRRTAPPQSPINVNILNDAAYNPLLGKHQGIPKPKSLQNNISEIEGLVFNDNGYPIPSLSFLIDGQTYTSDEKGNFKFKVKKALPQKIQLLKKELTVSTWSIIDQRLQISIRPKSLQHLIGHIADLGNAPIPLTKVLIVDRQGVFYETVSDKDGNFSIGFDEAVGIDNNLKILIDGYLLENISFTQKDKSEVFVNIIATPKETYQYLTGIVRNEDGWPVHDAFVKVQEKYYKTDNYGAFKAKVDKDFNPEYAIEVHNSKVIFSNFDPYRNQVNLTIKKYDTEDEESIVVIQELAEKRQASFELLEQHALSLKEKIKNNNTLWDEKQLEEAKTELSILKGLLASSQAEAKDATNSWMGIVEELEKSIIDREYQMRQVVAEKEKERSVFIKQLQTYLGFLVGLVLTVIILWLLLSNVKKQKKEIEKVKNELDDALMTINHQHMNIRDSIRYAQTMQKAIMVTPDLMKKYFEDHFIFYKPKDIVSGDFYWMYATQEAHQPVAYLAVADCTGHGVPGAMLSMIGSSEIQSIVKRGITAPNAILEELNSKILYMFRHETSITDGMDIAICKIEMSPEGSVLHFSGAKNGLYIISEGKCHYHKGSRKRIGGLQNKKHRFEAEEIKLKKGDWLILSTDGFYDQQNKESLKFGRKRFENLITQLHQNNAASFKDTLEQELSNHQKEIPQRDDITIVGFKC